MRSDTTTVFHARIVLEALTPHGIHSGRGDATHDVLLVRDANGLPALPGTSFIGVLRHRYREHHGEAAENDLFGFMNGTEGESSRISASWFLVNDSHNHAIEGIRDAGDIEGDDLLRWLSDEKPLVRQRVRLNHRGAAADTGKFDVTLVPAGTRYTGTLTLHSNAENAAASERRFEDLLQLLHGADFRLGHGTRSGSGAFVVRELHTARWNLDEPEGFQAYLARPRERTATKGLAEVDLKARGLPEDSHVLRIPLTLKAEAGWRIGGGEHPLAPPENGRDADLLPQTEASIAWIDGKGVITKRRPVVPGSAVKGALAHRLVFHYRRLVGDFVSADIKDDDSIPEATRELLGFATDHGTEAGQAGRLIIDDVYLPTKEVTVMRQMHNRIDHYTGGVMDGALFEEEQLWRSTLRLEIKLVDPKELEPSCAKALVETLHDLCSGWLPLGAGGSRGLGAMTGELPVHFDEAAGRIMLNKETKQ